MEEDVDVRSRGKTKTRKFAVWSIALIVIVGLSVATYSLTNRRKPLTLQEASQKLRPWCSGSVLKLDSHSRVMALAVAKDAAWDLATVSGLAICSKQKSVVVVLFFATPFDENQWLSKDSSGFKFQGASGQSPVFIGNGWLVVLKWVAKGAVGTEGQTVEWIANAFGVGYRFHDFPLIKQ